MLRKKTDRDEVMEQSLDDILLPLLRDKYVQSMKNYVQHGTTSTFQHCMNVADISYRFSSFWHLKLHYRAMLYGALLHDFYLYDWHITHLPGRMHGFAHSERASRNARNLLHQPEEITNIIETHMWPLNLTKIPKSREAWIVCLADTYVTFGETFAGKWEKIKNKRRKTA